MDHAIEKNGVGIVRTPTGVGVALMGIADRQTPVAVEVDYRGKRLKSEMLQPIGPPWRDYFGKEVDHLKVVVTVKQGDTFLAKLDVADRDQCLPFMVLQGPQHHITENDVSVPPALHITDERGAVWTVAFETAPASKSPKGEFAFEVLRDGVRMGEIASRIERRGGKIRIFTKDGWKIWNQDGLYFV